jgi:Ca2+-binding EF-hand superfamily protein
MDEQNTGYISFNEFRNYFSKVISHWSSLINTHVKIDKKKLTSIFREIDTSGDGIIDFNEYSSALERNPNLLDWFTLLNNGGDEITIPSPVNKN